MFELLQRLTVALPKIESWIDDLHAVHKAERSPLEAIAFELQAQFEFGTSGLSTEHVTRHALQARDAAALVFRANGLEMGA